MPSLDFTLNGVPQTLDYEEGTNLLELLREQCGIRSIKDGCAPEGICGCCTVLLDGRPTLACKTHPAKVMGREVTSLEGLGDHERKLLSRAFSEEQAVQCGFCTPGIMMRTHALLEKTPNPDLPRVQSALKGHVCRCTGYKSIERAIVRAAKDIRETPEGSLGIFTTSNDSAEESNSQGIGANLPRYHGEERALGLQAFVVDLEVPDMLHAALAFSPHPRATLKSLDLTKAKAATGVVAVHTWEDIPGLRHHGLIVRDWPLLLKPGEESHCVGDMLAIVVAGTRLQARKAASLVEAEWDILEPISDPATALEPDSPHVHESGNLLDSCSFARGDVESILASAPHRVKAVFTTQRIEHAFLEPEACLAVPVENGLHVFSQGQGVHDDCRQIAAILSLKEDQVLVELVPNGGAFGGKEDLSVQGHASLSAWLLKRPVKLALSRAESLRLHPKRHPIHMQYDVGADSDGTLRAAHIRMLGDTGAYASVGAKVLERAAGHSCGPYFVPAVDVQASAAYTNNPPCGAMRGFGVNQAAFAIENILDEIAHRTGVDRWDIRKKNILRNGQRFATGQIMTETVRGLERCLDALEPAYRAAPTSGLALGIKNTGIGNGMVDTGRVRIKILESSKLQIDTGFTDMGQGLYTILRQIVSEETNLPVVLMKVGTKSELALLCGMTTASRATALAGAAAGDAARKLAKDLASENLNDLIGNEYHGEFHCDITTAPDAKTDNPITHMTFGFAAQLVEMSATGQITKLVAAHDVGRAINPASCIGQIEGSLHMGLGYALSEDFPCDDAKPRSLRYKDLGVLRAHETPPMEVLLIEEPDPIGGYGVKGVGEIGLVPTAAAVAGALRARDGIMRTQLPMLEDRDQCLKAPKSHE
jgi:selenium-dependent xanthine dehydrogenase